MSTEVIPTPDTEGGEEETQQITAEDPLTQVVEEASTSQGAVETETETTHQIVEVHEASGELIETTVTEDSQQQTQTITIVQQDADGVTTGEPMTIVTSAGGDALSSGAVTITMVQAVDESGQLHEHEHDGVKIMSVTSGQTAAEQIAAAIAEAVAGTEEEGADITDQSQIVMEEEEDMDAEVSQEPWNEEGCLVCNKDIKFDDPAQLSRPNAAKLKDFFLEYLAVGDNVQMENENVFPFCEPCTVDIEKLMQTNRRIEHLHKDFNKLRDEIARKAVRTYITRAKPDWLEEDSRTEAYGNYFPEGEKPKTHKEQLLEVWKNRYDLVQPGPKGPVMIRSMDSRGRVTVVRLNSNGQPIPDRQLASTDSNLSRVARVIVNGEDEDSAGVEVYKCKECPKTFNIKAMLDYHMKIHANAHKPFKCHECGKGFAQRGGLVTHSLVHTGAKPYQCQVCGKAFRQKYHLTQHNLIHSGVKPFQCEICSKSFNVKMNLREHMRRHTGDRPYKCPFCTIIGFFRKKMLKEHIVKSHPEEEMPEELLGTDKDNYIVGDLEGEMDMDADGEAEVYSHHFIDESGAVIESGDVA